MSGRPEKGGGVASGAGGRLVDLSHPVTDGMMVYPGDPEVRIEPAAVIEDDGFAVAALHLSGHSGTHVDAPAHIVAGAASIDALPLELFCGRARVVAVPGCSPRQRLDVDDLDLSGVAVGDVVLVATGWDRWFGEEEYLAHPALSPEVATALLDLGVRAIGVDTLSPDLTAEPGEPVSLPFHEVFLGAGGVIYENLTGLTDLPPVVEFSGLPLRLGGGDGSPVRAVARIADDEGGVA